MNKVRMMSSVSWYRDLVRRSRGACRICGEPAKRADASDLAVDHDHGCCGRDSFCRACVRGLLCRRCNVGIGMFRDDPTLLRAAARYLETDKRRRAPEAAVLPLFESPAAVEGACGNLLPTAAGAAS